MTSDVDALHQLSPSTLRALAASLREGPLSLSLNTHVIRYLVGSESTLVTACLERLLRDGMAPRHIGLMLDGIAVAMEHSHDPAVLFELVLSGPDVSGVPTQETAATLQMLVQEAKKEVLLVGYVVYGGERIFRPLVKKLREIPGLRVIFCLDIARRAGDSSPDKEIVLRFAKEFREKQWPWSELPELYYDPRALTSPADGKASLHAKCVVVDRKAALITSANFTEAAQKRNIEVGLLAHYPPMAQRIGCYFQSLIERGVLKPCLL